MGICRNASYSITLCDGTVTASYSQWTYVHQNPLAALHQTADRMLLMAGVGFHNMYRGDDEDYAGSIESLTGCPGRLTEALSSALGGFVDSPAVQLHNSRLVWV